MKINSHKSDEKFSIPRFGLLLLLLAICPQRAMAQTQTNTFPASGNVGIGTTSPNAKLVIASGNIGLGSNDMETWTAATSVVESLNTSVFFGQVTDLHLISNAYHNGGWKYKSSGPAADYYLYNGTHAWRVAPSGTVDTAISWIDAMTISNSGNVGIGTTTPSSKLHIVSGTDNGTALLNLDTGVHGGTSMLVYGSANNESGYDLSVYRAGQYFSRFGVNNYGHVYLQPGGGSVGVGTTTPGYRLDVQGGQINSSGGLCIAGDCKTAWSQVGGGGSSQWTTAGANIYYNSGNVGIGTTSPTAKLHVYGSGNMAGIVQSTTAGAELDLISSATNYGSWGMGTGWATAGVRSFYLYDNVASAARLMIDASGNVGIGTTTPAASYKLDVNGGINSSGNINATGNITASGTISAKYQDVAEWVPASHALPAGTVVTLDPTKSNHVEASSHAYDTRVAGVVSAQPGITLGEKGDSKVLVATTGRVKVMVDAAGGPIQVGDLLVTSDIAGVAKKSEPLLLGGVPIHRPGTLIGKALEPLAKGRGEILVLLSLQ